jgi:hypothetical protein
LLPVESATESDEDAADGKVLNVVHRLSVQDSPILLVER